MHPTVRAHRNARLPFDVGTDVAGEELPDWVLRYRDSQVQAVRQIMQAYDDGVPVVLLEAPTGAGKTLIAESVRRLLYVRKALYICSTKPLQDQFAGDFQYAKVLKGRSNYPTWISDEISAADCTKSEANDDGIARCNWCPIISLCPYEQAKAAALASPLAVINTAYMLAEANGPGRFSKREFTIVDEADLLEEELMRYVEVRITPQRVKQMKLGEPEKVTKEESWIEWVAESIPKAKNNLLRFPEGIEDIRQIREKNAVERVYHSLLKLARTLVSGTWIYTGKDGEVAFKPVTVNEEGKYSLWRHSQKWLLMSAYFGSPTQFLSWVGYDGPYSVVRVPSSFPRENRLVKVMPLCDMSGHKDQEKRDREREKCSRAVSAILARHPGERVLVHTVSYDLAGYLQGAVDAPSRASYSYRNAEGRSQAMADFQRDTSGAVLYAPSMDRGIDLPDDACRVIIVAKTPYPNVGDRQISTRLYGTGFEGKLWYAMEAIKTVVQMTGRATRHQDDYSTTYIIDSAFSTKLWSEHKALFPSWWTEALDFRDMVRV